MKRFAATLLVVFFFFASSALAEPKPQRIVSLTLGTDEILLSIVDPKRIVAITKHAADPGISNVSNLAKGINTKIKHPSVEMIVALQPDLVFAASYSPVDVVNQLQALGLRVVKLTNFSSIKAIKENIRRVAQTVGELDKGEFLISQMNARLRSVRKKIATVKNRPRLLSYSLVGWTSGKETLFDEIVTLVGGRNLAAEAGIVKHPKISLEAVVDLNPEILILNAWQPDTKDTNEKLLAHPALQTISAVKSGRVYAIPGKHLTSVSHFIVEGVEALARLLHPNLFGTKISKQ